jgi:hypothetical protein
MSADSLISTRTSRVAQPLAPGSEELSLKLSQPVHAFATKACASWEWSEGVFKGKHDLVRLSDDAEVDRQRGESPAATPSNVIRSFMFRKFRRLVDSTVFNLMNTALATMRW